MKKIINEMKLRLPAISGNEGVCRAMISAFVSGLDPTLDELGDLRCAVSEAVTNCVVHAYPNKDKLHSFIYISARLYDNKEVSIEISDKGCGIVDLELALTPGYTEGGEGERSGMGFFIMESFTDSVKVKSTPGRGTVILMKKKFSS